MQVKEGRMSIPEGPGVGIREAADIWKGAKEV